jgi:hypothetical protein
VDVDVALTVLAQSVSHFLAAKIGVQSTSARAQVK